MLATLISMTAVRGICSSIWLFTFQFTLFPAAIVIVLYFIIAVIASEVGIYLWGKRKHYRTPQKSVGKMIYSIKVLINQNINEGRCRIC